VPVTDITRLIVCADFSSMQAITAKNGKLEPPTHPPNPPHTLMLAHTVCGGTVCQHLKRIPYVVNNTTKACYAEKVAHKVANVQTIKRCAHSIKNSRQGYKGC
jgi:hypothetical protein